MAERRLRATPYIAALAWRQPSLLLQSAVLLLLMAVVNLPLPLLNKLAIDHAIPAGDALPLILIGVLAFGVRAVASGFQVFQNYVIWRLMAEVGDSLRRRMVQSLLGAPYDRYVAGEIGGYVGRLTTDVDAIEHIILDTFRFILRPLAMLAVMVLVMGLVNLPLTLLVLVATPVAVVVTRRLAHELRDRQEDILERRQDLQRAVTEVLDNLRVIRAYVREDRFRATVGEHVRGYTAASVTHATRRQFAQSLIDLIGLLPWLVLVAVGAWLVEIGQMQVGDLMLFVTFEQLLRSPLGQLTYYLQHIRGEMAAPERVEAVIDLPLELPFGPDTPGAQPPEGEQRLRGSIDIEDLHFAYADGSPLFAGLDLHIAAGERVALVGPSGAGKTSLFNLLLGFYRPQAGHIRFDGRDLEEIGLQRLRREVGVVFQNNPFFDGSIRENLELDLPAQDEQRLWWALDQADCADFVAGLPERLETAIGIKGLKLSGGQRQRLAIARALLRDPRVVLLDEATASLDSLSEQRIQTALDHLLAGRSSLTIAHRLSTVVASDRICYLEDGRITESGSHRELLAAGGAYAHLFQTQMAGLLNGEGPG